MRKKPVFRTAIELHDSTVAAVVTTGDNVVVRFAPACVHRSTGVPGVEGGTVWSQDAILTFRDGRLMGNPPQVPTLLADGHAEFNGEPFNNIIPLDKPIQENVRFAFQLADGSCFEIHAATVEFEFAGSATTSKNSPASSSDGQAAGDALGSRSGAEEMCTVKESDRRDRRLNQGSAPRGANLASCVRKYPTDCLPGAIGASHWLFWIDCIAC